MPKRAKPFEMISDPGSEQELPRSINWGIPASFWRALRPVIWNCHLGLDMARNESMYFSDTTLVSRFGNK